MLKGTKIAKTLSLMVVMALVFEASAGCSKSDSPKTPGAEITPKASGSTPAAKTTEPKANTMPIVKDKITLNFVGMNMNTTRVGRHDETDMMKKLEQDTNIKIVWEMIPQASWKEKKNLMIASRQLPDAFMGPLSLNADEIQKFGADGVLIPLDKLLAEYAPTITGVMKDYPLYDTYTRSLDGKIYALARMEDLGFDSLSTSVIRKEWLDKLGLKMPTTTEEFRNVLREFKAKDPAGNGKTIPFSFLYQEGPDINREVKREHEWIFAAFGVYDNPKHVAIDDNGQMVFTADKDRYKEAVKYLNSLYSEGLIDKEVFTQDRTLLTNKVRNQLNVGVYTDYRMKESFVTKEIEDKFAIMPPLKGPHGDQKWLRATTGLSDGAFAITSACKYPEAAIRWVDHINEPELNIQMSYGMFKEEGYNKSEALVPSKAQPGKYDVNTGSRPKEVNASDWPFSSPIAVSPTLTSKKLIDKYLADKPSNVAKNEACDVYRPYLTKNPYNYPYRFTVDEIEELSLIQTDLLSYIFKTQAKWISDGGIDAEWDNYLAQLKKLKVDKYLELYKKSYERSLKK